MFSKIILDIYKMFLKRSFKQRTINILFMLNIDDNKNIDETDLKRFSQYKIKAFFKHHKNIV